MSSKRSLFVRLVPCSCLRGEEETVTSLDYSHCSLEQVPKEIFSFEKTLEELYLDANQIEELPKVRVHSCTTNTLALHVSKNLIQCLDGETLHFILAGEQHLQSTCCLLLPCCLQAKDLLTPQDWDVWIWLFLHFMADCINVLKFFMHLVWNGWKSVIHFFQ